VAQGISPESKLQYCKKRKTCFYIQKYILLFLTSSILFYKYIYYSFFFFETGSHHLAQAGLKFAILLTQPPKLYYSLLTKGNHTLHTKLSASISFHQIEMHVPYNSPVYFYLFIHSLIHTFIGARNWTQGFFFFFDVTGI
jgi:hypothetical protein